MRAAIKQAESMERTKWQTVQKKSKTRNTAFKTRHIFDVQINRKNIRTGTVDHWVWIMDQELRAAFGQYIEGRVFFFFGIIAKLTHIFSSMSTLIFFLFLPNVNSMKIPKTFSLSKRVLTKLKCEKIKVHTKLA